MISTAPSGRRGRVDPRTLFTGPQSRVDKYASEELKNYFDQHGRVTATEFRRAAARQRAEYQEERAARRRGGGRDRLYGVY